MAEIIDLDDSIERVKDCLQEMHLGIAKNHKCQRFSGIQFQYWEHFHPQTLVPKKLLGRSQFSALLSIKDNILYQEVLGLNWWKYLRELYFCPKAKGEWKIKKKSKINF